MAYGLEARVPLLDDAVLAIALRMPDSQKHGLWASCRSASSPPGARWRGCTAVASAGSRFRSAAARRSLARGGAIVAARLAVGVG